MPRWFEERPRATGLRTSPVIESWPQTARERAPLGSWLTGAACVAGIEPGFCAAKSWQAGSDLHRQSRLKRPEFYSLNYSPNAPCEQRLQGPIGQPSHSTWQIFMLPGGTRTRAFEPKPSPYQLGDRKQKALTPTKGVT